MELWTDYEGITIDGAFPLKKLLLSEGRSAFFSTSNGKGDQTLIRLIACHFDEQEILARWRGVEALNHPGFLKLERYGQLLLDEVTVVYAVFERAEANLSQVVNERRLTPVETSQLAASLSSALQTLHANGFVHEHVNPSNVFAVGDFVKLRTDCIRETPEGDAGIEAKKRDVLDLSVVLLEALTQERTLDSSSRAVAFLPAPFDQIVPKGMSGVWGLAQIASALESATPARPSSKSAAASRPTPVPPPVAIPVNNAIPVAKQAVQPPATASNGASANGTSASPTATTSRPAAVPPPSRTPAPPEQGTLFSSRAIPTSGYRIPLQDRFLLTKDSFLANKSRARWIGAAALAAVVLLLAVILIARLSHHSSANTPATAPSAAATSSLQPSAATPSRSAVSKPRASAPSLSTAHSSAAVSHSQWRVVAYTFNRQDQAQHKSATIAQKHPGLHPEVFTPNGRAPFLVTVGGVMDRDQAFAFAHKSRSLGLPRDTYAQNYGVNDR